MSTARPPTLKSRAEIEKMRQAGRIVAEVLARLEEALRPGVSTARLDRIAEEHISRSGGRPNFKGYHDYPSTICISIDDQVVHGIPFDRTIREGQVVSIDAGASLEGWHGDAARTWIIGDAGPRAALLVEATRRALDAGIAAAQAGRRIWDISAAVEDVALPLGLGVVEFYGGHGIGTAMHEEPHVPNYRTPTRGIELRPGICLAIEPMFTLGQADVATLDDGWTVVTRDGSLAAHFEDTVAVTDDGPLVLTRL